MGETIRPGTQIRDFTPDDTPDKFYIEGAAKLTDIYDRAFEKWKPPEGQYDALMESLTVTPEYIHTRCLGYDLYDRSDYTNYLCVERKVE